MPKQKQMYASGLERVEGIEPSYEAWKATALPLSYTRAAGAPLPPLACPRQRANRVRPIVAEPLLLPKRLPATPSGAGE